MLYIEVESYSAAKPPEVDTKSSKTTVYLRRNIKAVSNAEGGGTHWSMEEAKIPREEYVSMQSAVYQSLAERMDSLDEANASILLEQAEIQEAQSEQDSTLADILLNQVEDDSNEQTV